MPTALTGSLGWTGLHPIQLGGPPLVHSWTRPLAVKAGPLGAEALPLLAHAYANDGVTPNATSATFGILNRPVITARTTNGGLNQIALEVAAPIAGLTQGNVIRLTEIGGPFTGFVYSGIVESFPDTLSPAGTKHEIALSPYGIELTRVAVQLVYAAPVDIAQIVRDAVATTQHCSCDQVSVPTTTGILASTSTNGIVDFRGQKVTQVLDTCRSIAGATWFWHADELGRVWFQFQGSAATYTLMGGQHYSERTSNGGDIVDRINQVHAVGGVPVGGSANAQATVTGSSASPGPTSIGIRTLEPPLSMPGISDQPTLTAVAVGVLATLDQVWTRFALKALPTFASRVHGSQPGGAMVRYWEPGKNPLPQTGAAAGYVGPFICHQVAYGGLTQDIEAGTTPVTSQSDVTNLVQSLVSRSAANQLQVFAASLNLPQTLTGTFQSGTGTLGPLGQQAALWSLTQQMLQAFDPAGVARFQAGNVPVNGISPAQWGGRVNAADGTPIWDSIGVLGLPKRLAEVINTAAVQGSNTTFADVTGAVTPTFTLSRQANLLVMAMGRIAAQPASSATNTAFLGLRCGSSVTSGAPGEVDSFPTLTFVPYCLFFWVTMAAGSYTAALQANAQPGPSAQWNVAYADVIVFQFGG